jgi:hypothetical protein
LLMASQRQVEKYSTMCLQFKINMTICTSHPFRVRKNALHPQDYKFTILL